MSRADQIRQAHELSELTETVLEAVCVRREQQ